MRDPNTLFKVLRHFLRLVLFCCLVLLPQYPYHSVPKDYCEKCCLSRRPLYFQSCIIFPCVFMTFDKKLYVSLNFLHREFWIRIFIVLHVATLISCSIFHVYSDQYTNRIVQSICGIY